MTKDQNPNTLVGIRTTMEGETKKKQMKYDIPGPKDETFSDIGARKVRSVICKT